MTRDQFLQLLNRYLQDKLNTEELQIFLTEVRLESNLQLLDAVLLSRLEQKAHTGQADKRKLGQLFDDVLQRAALQNDDTAETIVLQPPKKVFSFFRLTAAAILILIVSAVSYFYFLKNTTSIASSGGIQGDSTSIQPGSNKAILTLADGSQIILDNTNEGTISSQGNSKVIKLNSGQIAYKSAGGGNKQVLYNTISTPKGGTYEVILPDNSKVWLNALSSIRFPTLFTGAERRLEMNGEAYFEVAKNKEKPFVIRVNDMEVKVLGTHFNIMAYTEEKMVKTTLLEGSVQVNTSNKTALLKPNQQLRAAGNTSFEVASNIDVNEVIAWKNGFFQFDDTNLATIMRQLGRWYDVNITFQNQEVAATLFSGKIARSQSLESVLTILKLSGVNFELNGRNIIVKA